MMADKGILAFVLGVIVIDFLSIRNAALKNIYDHIYNLVLTFKY